MKTEFDEKAADWDENPDRVKRAESIADSIRTRINLQKVKKALEYGSGTGLLSFALQQDLKSVVLMDESIEMTKVALEKCQRFKVNHFKPMQYNLIEDPEEKYDVSNQHPDVVQRIEGIMKKAHTPSEVFTFR